MNAQVTKEYFDDNYYTLLAGYASGSLSEAEAMIVASHLTLKPSARQIVNRMEAIGGSLLCYDLEPETVSGGCFDAVMSLLDEEVPQANTEPENIAMQNDLNEFDFPVPEPVLAYIRAQEQALKWKRVLKGLEVCEIPLTKSQKTEFLRIAPGKGVPAHTHQGEEITLLLDGAFEDETGRYEQGDLIIVDERISHHPVSDAQTGCVCMSVTSAPIKMTGPLMRLLNPFLK